MCGKNTKFNCIMHKNFKIFNPRYDTCNYKKTVKKNTHMKYRCNVTFVSYGTEISTLLGNDVSENLKTKIVRIIRIFAP
jgi:hypothetical protein